MLTLTPAGDVPSDVVYSGCAGPADDGMTTRLPFLAETTFTYSVTGDTLTLGPDSPPTTYTRL